MGLIFLSWKDFRLGFYVPDFPLAFLPPGPLSDDGGEVELLPLVPCSCSPIFLRGHRSGANQRFAAEEDRPVDLGEGKTSEQAGSFSRIFLCLHVVIV